MRTQVLIHRTHIRSQQLSVCNPSTPPESKCPGMLALGC
ncbi:hypothetical protein LEMLEM_LOCUS3650 [Lemmus lemmus]